MTLMIYHLTTYILAVSVGMIIKMLYQPVLNAIRKKEVVIGENISLDIGIP
tara:strand:+ start:493 stop:645 length:153 start_codon:yes stop_codon:yes gene_type:complete